MGNILHSALKKQKVLLSVVREQNFFFITNKVFNIDHSLLDIKIRLRINIIPHKNLKVTITYKKVD